MCTPKTAGTRVHSQTAGTHVHTRTAGTRVLENDNETGWEGRLGPEKLRQGLSRRGRERGEAESPRCMFTGLSPFLSATPTPSPPNPGKSQIARPGWLREGWDGGRGY